MLSLALAAADATTIAIVDLKDEVFGAFQHFLPQLEGAAEVNDGFRRLPQLLVHLRGRMAHVEEDGWCGDGVSMCTLKIAHKTRAKGREVEDWECWKMCLLILSTP